MKSTSAKIWNAETGAEVFSLVGHTARVRGIDFSPDGKLIATGSRDGTVRIWDAGSGKEAKKFGIEKRGTPVEIHDLQFTADGKILIAATADGVKALDVSSGGVLFRAAVRANPTSTALSPDGRLFAFGDQYSTIYICDTIRAM